MKITKKQSPNYTQGRKGYIPDMVVCHITEGSYNGAVSWLCNPQAQASSHFVVSRDGDVTQLVELTDMAWCNGTSTDPTSKVFYGNSTNELVKSKKTNANYYTVSIEHEGIYSATHGELTEPQQRATTELIEHISTELKRLYGKELTFDREHIIGHYEVAPKTKPNCPGDKFPFDEIIKNLKGSENMINVPVDTICIETPKEKEMLFNNTPVSVTATLIDNNNYIKLRDIEKFGLTVDYDSAKNIPTITA